MIYIEFNRLNSPGITAFILKMTGIAFDQMNAKMRDDSFTPDEAEAVKKALEAWERKSLNGKLF